MLRFFRLDEGLRRKAHVVEDVVTGRALDPWRLITQALRVLVQAPDDVQQPGEAPLRHDNLQLRESLEHTMADQAYDVRLKNLSQSRVPFNVVGGRASGHSWSRDENAIDGVGMDRYGQLELRGSLVNGVVVTLPH